MNQPHPSQSSLLARTWDRIWRGPAPAVNAPGLSVLRLSDQGSEADIEDRAPFRSARTVTLISLLVACMLSWAWLTEIAEVSSGQGTVIPSSGSQVIQSLEGGILQDLNVRPGQLVDVGEELAVLDATRTRADLDEINARYVGALARKARLEAELAGSGLAFPEEIAGMEELITSETALFESRAEHLRRSRQDIDSSLALVRSELSIAEQLAEAGAASEVELLRLRRTAAELQRERNEIDNRFIVQAREDMAEVRTEIEALASTLRGRDDELRRRTVRSPVRGRVQNLETTTIGGVIPPNGKLMEIVPQDEQLLIEARIAPRDIAFIHPGQQAKVKITAYDYATYGALDGEVTMISPDTVRDEVNPEVVYYQVFIQTDGEALSNGAELAHAIAPGMIAEVDIQTGDRTVLDYLIKPFNRMNEAMRER